MILPIVLSILCIYNFWQEKNKEELLKNGSKTFGIFISRNERAVHGSPSINVRYKVNGTKYILKEYGGFPSLKVGDTVLVEYAVEDNSVARVVGKLKK